MGFTASNSESGSRINLVDWDLWVVNVTSENSYSALAKTQTNYKINEKIYVKIYFRNGCNARYTPADYVDNAQDLSFDNRFAQNCYLLDRNFVIGFDYDAQISVYCSKAGAQRLIVYYQGKIIGIPLNINIISDQLDHAKIDFFQGAVGTIDNPFKFRFIPYDSNENLPNITTDVVRASLNISWPSPVDTNQNYLITKDVDGTFVVAISTDKVGNYLINNYKLFIRYVMNGVYPFSIDPGDVYAPNSFARLINPAKFEVVKGTIGVGTTLLLNLYLKDRANNSIPTSHLDQNFMKVALTTNGAQSLLTSPQINYIFFAYSFLLTKAGSASISINYKALTIPCQYCQLTVVASVSLFEKAQLYQYSNVTNNFIERDQSEYTINKGDNFLFELILKDKYDNTVPVSVVSIYTASLSGNNMNPIQLTLSPYGQGIKLEVPKDQDAYFKNLVGMGNYSISVVEAPTKKLRIWNLTIVSDKTDNGAGNGDYVAANTIWFWLNPLVQNQYAVAGQTYRVAVQLMTNQSLRYNGYIDESLIKLNFVKLYPELGEIITGPRRTAITGTYTFTFSLIKGVFSQRTIGFTITGVVLSKTKTFLDYPDVAYKAAISSDSLLSTSMLLQGEISKPYSFGLVVFDRYNNPNNYADQTTILAFKSSDKSISQAPVCSKTTIGVYSCVITMTSPGNYTVESSYFANAAQTIYYINFKTGKPSILTSSASILDDLSKGKNAGSQIQFRIVVKDDSGQRLKKDDIMKILPSFSLTLQEPSSQSLKPVPLLSVTDLGEILTTATLNTAGRNTFFPRFETQNIPCPICSVDIQANEDNTGKVLIYSLDGTVETLVLSNSSLTIDNSKKDPIYILRFRDSFNNTLRTPTDGIFTAKLIVPGGAKAIYEYETRPYGDNAVLMRIKDVDYLLFQSELRNNRAKLNFTSQSLSMKSLNFNASFNTTLKGVSANDDDFSNDLPDPAHVVINPLAMTITAGDWTDLSIELRTANDKLYNHPDTFGWYKNKADSLKMVVEDGSMSLIPGVINGKNKGTYLLHFTCYKAYPKGVYVNVSYLSPADNVTFIQITKRFRLTVNPAAVKYVVMDESTVKNTVVGLKTMLSMKPYDLFGNLINNIAVNALNVVMKSTNANETAIIPTLTQNTEGEVIVSYVCYKPGRITITSLKFKDSANKVIANYTYLVNAGPVNSLQSIAMVDVNTITAGGKINWMVYPRDAFNNPLPCNGNDILSMSAARIPPGVGQAVAITETIQISNNNDYYYWSIALTSQGVHEFKAFWKGDLVASTNNKVTVNADKADFLQATLALYNSKTNTYDEYDGTKFYQDVANYPEYKVVIYDDYKNKLSNIPSDWQLSLFFTSVELKDNGIALCFDSISKNFKMCNDNKLQPNLVAPMKRWGDLVVPRDYSLTLKNTNNNNQKVFVVGLAGTSDGGSNLPIEVQNTLISPIRLDTQVNQTAEFTITIMTTDKTLRRNEWFDDPNSSINIIFSKNNGQIPYSISKGEKKGIYKCSLTSTIAYTIDPNVIQVLVTKILVQNKNVQLYVTPGLPYKFYPYDLTNKVQVTDVKTGSIDATYVQSFVAKDYWSNQINLNVDTIGVNSQLYDPSQNPITLVKAFPVDCDAMTISFDAKTSGTFQLVFNTNSIFSIIIQQGAINVPKSLGSVSPSAIRAGDLVTVSLSLRDQLGNDLALTADFVSKYTFQYFFSLPFDTVYNQGTSQLIVKNNQVTFTQKLTVKGVHKFKVTVNSQPIDMSNSRVDVSPSDPSFLNSLLLYLNDETNQYLMADPEVPIKENNVKYDPIYSLILTDKYGNEINIFPQELTNQFAVILYGNDYAIDNPLHFYSNKTNGDSLSITISDADRERYRAGTFEKTPYTLAIAFQNTQSLKYQVTLLGSGDNDTDAEIEKPLDLSKTYFDKTVLKLEAGYSDTFLMELRTASGKRKSDVGNIPIKLSFLGSDGKPDNCTYDITPGTLKGRYLIRVSGTESNDKVGPTVVSVNVNGSLVPATLKLTITPTILDHLNCPSDLSVVGNADKDYNFIIIPYDKYNNVAYVKTVDLNLVVKFPSTYSGVKEVTSFVDPASGYAIYTVKSRAAGDYSINSQYLSQMLRFSIIPGAVNQKFTKVLVNPNKIRAGESTFVDIYPADSYNNLINPIGSRQGECTSQVKLNYIQDKVLNQAVLIPNSQNNSLSQSLKLTKVGFITVVVSVSSNTVACDSCVVEVIPNIANLPSTVFYIMNIDGSLLTTTHPTSPYGARDLSLLARLFDAYGNALVSIEANEMFKMTMRGNNMKSLDLILTKAENQLNALFIDVDSNDQDYFSRLVVANNYALTFFYLVNSVTKDSTNLPLDITGNSDDSGNGDIDINKTVVTPLNINLIAGIESSVLIEFRTSENKRYNGLINIASVVAKETADSKGTQKLSMFWSFGDKSGRFRLGLKGYEALAGTDFKYLQISIDGQVYSKLVVVDIDPDVPVPSKTEILQKLPDNLKGGQKVNVSFRLYDQYDNVYSKADWATKINGQVSQGKAIFSSATFDASNNAYAVSITPLYPPRVLFVQMVMIIDNFGTAADIHDPEWICQVMNDLDLTKTELTGQSLNGVSLGKDYNFFVLLKDTSSYCYEGVKAVTAVISGPFADSNLASKVLVPNNDLRSFTREAAVKMGDVENSGIESNGAECEKYYQVTFYGNQIQSVGYYLIEIFVDQNATANYRYKNVYMSAGSAFPSNSFATLVTPQGLSSDAVLSVYTTINMQVTLKDSFKNSLTSTSGSSLSLQINGYNSPADYVANITGNKGYYDIQLLVKKVGALPGGAFNINGILINWKVMDQSNFPNSFTFTAAACSNAIPNIDAAGILANKSVIGYKTSFSVNCLDSYGNVITKGGDQFSAQIISIGDLTTAQSINIKVNVNDLSNGAYRFDFVPLYSGLYKVIIQLNNQPYGSIFFFQVINGLCTAAKPYYCINSKKCVASYMECGYSDLTCPTTDKPFKCQATVNGQSSVTCVRTQEECDCADDNSLKCKASNKCVDMSNMDYLCSFKGQNPPDSCPSDYPVVCSDGSCRVALNQCPSQPGCPPEYQLCPDLSCVDKTLTCPDRGVQCPDDRLYRCDDFTCVAAPDDCPTRVTCPVSTQIVCPDGSCVDSELQCKSPRVCETGLVLCSDGSCMKRYEDCSKGITCPNGWALCSDGICKKQCTLLTASKPKLARLLRILDGNNTSNDSDTASSCLANQTLCKGTDLCVDQSNLCPNTPVCKENEVKCSDFSCASSQKDCNKRACGVGLYACWDKTCVKDKSLCPTRISCPANYPVLCSDGECVNSSDSCRSSIKCPPYRPIRCGTGECKKSYDECPVQTLCPSKNPIRCQDGSCVNDKSVCESIVDKIQCDVDQIRCGDGSCSVSYSLCPTMVSCASTQIRCWNMACADDISSCDPISGETVCDSDKIQCPDGSCADLLADCPTGLICPSDRPVKCDDGNCKTALSECLHYSDCPEGYKRCPDGSCQNSQGRCSSLAVTCSEASPYKCYDNTCRKNPFDCPTMRECSLDTPILCVDGTCVAERINCPVADVCPLSEPVRCPDNLCYPSVKSCKELTGCPSGKLMCNDGTCISSDGECPIVECPSTVPHKCANGVCVLDLSSCDNTQNGCPADKPNKCKDGQCVADVGKCPSNVACSGKLALCPDGTCRASLSSCPLANGCPKLFPLLCQSGQCIDPKKESCPIAICPSNLPFRCPDGLCMAKWNACPSTYLPSEQNPCINNALNKTLICANGLCVSSLEECKPVFGCGKNQQRCLDGSCKSNGGVCSLAPNSCPIGLGKRCLNGACVNNSKNCLNSEGCPEESPIKCGSYGLCAKSHEDCNSKANNLTLRNGCPLTSPIKCKDQCVNSSDLCIANKSNCDKGFFECIDGTCQKNYSLCPSKCPSSLVKCPNSKECKEKLSDCPLSNGCPSNTSKKCSDGSCISAFQTCPPHIVCPPYKPHLCADFECVGEPSQCSVMPPCSDSLPFRSSDLSCQQHENGTSNNCPPTNPIKCHKGQCVDTIEECTDESSQCDDEKPYLCDNQECVVSPSSCVNLTIRSGLSHRILTSASLSVVVDQGCDSTNPKLCSDGSCRTSYSDCDLIKGCFEPGYNYRCQSGQCAASEDECTDDKTIGYCAVGTQRCEDGVCRVECPEYDGCSRATPLQCFNGFCGKISSDCLTRNNKAVCADNTEGNCQRPIRTYQAEKITLTVSKYLAQTVSFISNDKTNAKYASITIPSGAFLTSNNNYDYPYDILTIQPVAHSSIINTANSFSNDRIMKQLFPGTSKLSPEQFIRSSIFSLDVQNRTDNLSYAQSLNLTISFDTLEGLNTQSYCLGFLLAGSNQWTCEDTAQNNQVLNEKRQLSFSVSRDGVYAVMLALKPTSYLQGSIAEVTECDWWCSNGGAVIGALIGVLIGGLVFGVFFFAFTRYANGRKGQGIEEGLMGEAKNDKESEGKKRIEEITQNLSQKNKILEESENEKKVAKEQRELLEKQVENLKMELNKSKDFLLNKTEFN